ncbi:MAG: hypothetical protein JNK88_10475, partial [Mangrovicoccus sp.]|nr:hypothetical protein [Mangrovicoccus sp.]
MDAHLRDKDRDLGRRCREAATAASEAVDWLAAHRPGAGNAALQKQLRRHAVEARRLAAAA